MTYGFRISENLFLKNIYHNVNFILRNILSEIRLSENIFQKEIIFQKINTLFIYLK